MSPLLNYTTKISAIKTAGEVSGLLVGHGAKAILTEYGQNNEVVALSFKVLTPHGELAIRLPVDADATLRVMMNQSRQGRVPRHLATREQALRVAWRIVKDWVEAQMAILETEMVRMEQIFLPYMITQDGRTLYERMIDTKFQLPEGETK